MSVKTSIMLQNQMTPVLEGINRALNYTITAMEETERASKGMFNTSTLHIAKQELANMSVELDKIERESIENAKAQEKHNVKIKQGNNLFDGMKKKIVGVLAAYGGMRSFNWLKNTSDELTSINARLNLAKEEFENIDELQSKIFAAAQNARGDYMLLADATSKMSLMGGDAFKDTQEVIDFNEQLSKHFVVSGASAEGQAAAMYQLNQAMAMGVLRGQEYNSINENANTVIDAMAKHLNVTKGEIKAMADEGKISAELVKQSVLAMSEETNAKFEQMPKTFSQVATSFKNNFVREMQPALMEFNALLNSQKFEAFSANATQALVSLAHILNQVVSLGVSGFNWMYDNSDLVINGIIAITGAMVAWNTMTIIQNLALQGLGITLQSMGLMAFALAIGLIIVKIKEWVDSVGGINIAWKIFWDDLKTGFENGKLQTMEFERFVNDGFEKLDIGIRTWAVNVENYFLTMLSNTVSHFERGIGFILNLINGAARLSNNLLGTDFEANLTVSGINEGIENTKQRNIDRLEEAANRQQANKERRANEVIAQRISNATNQRNRALEIKTLQENKAIANKLQSQDATKIEPARDYTSMFSDTNDLLKDIKDEISWENNNLSGLRDLMQSRAITELSKEIKLEVYNEFSGNVSTEVDLETLKNEVTNKIVEDIEVVVNGGV